MTQTPENTEGELRVKDLILFVKDWSYFFIRKWKLLLISGLLGTGLGFGYAQMQKTNYVAELTFVLEETKMGGLGSYSGIASQLGIDLGGTGASGLFSSDNIIQFLRSRLMVEQTLLSSISVNNKQISLADCYIDFEKLRQNWEKNERLRDLHFPVNADRSKFTLQQDSILNTIYISLIKKNLVVNKADKKLSFIWVVCKTHDELFSKVFIEQLVANATAFYVQTKTKRSKANVDILQQKADSLNFLLGKKTYSAAANQDLNLNPARRVATVNTELLTLDKTVLQAMYGEVVKNLELSKFTMQQETPLIQIVDSPILPLKKEKFGKLKGMILGGFLGGLVMLLFISAKRLYNKIMA